MLIVISLSISLIGLTAIENSGYNSYVDTFEESYFKVLELEEGISYNFTIDIEEYYQMDLGFSIHLDEKVKEKNALVTVDNPGTSDETTLYTPTTSSDYYVRVFSNYDWGFFTITVREQISGIEKIVEPYSVPVDWTWLWISAVVIGGIIVLVLIAGFFMAIVAKIDWTNIRLPKIKLPEIDVDWESWRERRRATLAQSKARRQYLRNQRKEARKLKRLKRERKEVFIKEKISERKKSDIEILYIKDTTRKCMVSGLPIDFSKEKVVACPFCGNIAKEPMLTEWLKVKGICPICREKLVIDFCTKVMVAI